ncbi:sigma-70 family RNA polymerase sigma factor [Virgibacillus sp. FSP13]
MNKDNKVTFEEIFKQNERRIHYQIHKLRIQDPHREFYVEGLYAMWLAYKKYKPDQGLMSTYFNYTIRNRLIDMIRKKTREQDNNEFFTQEEERKAGNGNRSRKDHLPLVDTSGITVKDDALWQEIKAVLTENQWKWVKCYVIDGMPLKEIAEQEDVTIDAVKSWSREARKKLRNAGVKEALM